MRLVVTTETYLPFVAGVSTSTDNIARFMARFGHEVTLVAPKPVKGDPVKAEDRLRFAYTPSLPDFFFQGKSFSPIPLALPTLFQAIKNVRLVHIQEPGAIGFMALCVAKLRHVPIVGAFHFTPEQIFRILFFPKIPLFIWFVQLYIRWFYNQCDGIMVPTQTFARYLQASGIRTPIQVVSNGVDTNYYLPTPDIHAKREVYNLPKDKILFFFLGRLDVDKHADTIIRALPQTTDSIHLVIGGEGKEKESFQRLARELGVFNRITWLGHLDQHQMLDVYQSVDVFVLMSPYEVQSIVTLQAISCGIPILACKEGALPELCHDGVNGFTIPFKDFSYLAEKMNVLAGDASIRTRMGEESRKLSFPHDQTRALTSLEALYQRVVSDSLKKSSV